MKKLNIFLKNLKKNYDVDDLGAVHIGAHTADDRRLYEESGFKKISWIETNPSLFLQLKMMINESPITDLSEAAYNFGAFGLNQDSQKLSTIDYSTNSPFIELGSHSRSAPEVAVDPDIEMPTLRIDSLLREEPQLFEGINLANLVIQGGELHVLDGFGVLLDQLRWVCTKVNRDQACAGSGLISDIDYFMVQHRFFRVLAQFDSQGWGQLFYIKIQRPSWIFLFYYKIKRKTQYIIYRFTK